MAWKEGELWRQRFIHRDDIDRAWQNRGRDLYFCPNLFSRPERDNEHAVASRWAYADLDEVDPSTIEAALTPTIWWETSPGRFQALWELDKALSRKAHDQLNQKLTYYLHADLNGWPMNKVLRMPGSVSTKWGKPFHIVEGGLNGGISVRSMWDLVRDTHTPSYGKGKVRLSLADKQKVAELLLGLDKGTRMLLRRRYIQDRSTHIYHLAKNCVEAGIKADDIALILSTSPVAKEKYGNRMEEELARVVAKVALEPTKPKKKRKKIERLFNAEPMNKFLAREILPPGWLVGGIWSSEAHGVVAGEEKTYKSMIAQDLAVSVASGTEFLGHFPVPEDKVGPVIYAQEENPVPMVHDRFLKICHARGLDGRNGKLPEHLPLFVLNNQQVNLTQVDHMQELARLVDTHKAKLLVLDPFYLMAPGVDENSATEVGDILRDLLRIKQQLNCGILIVHHYKKQDRKNPMFAETGRISGTGVFGRWYESLLLIERGEEDKQVKLYAKHRLAAPEPPVIIDFDMGDMGDIYYHPKVVDVREEARDLYAELRAGVEEQPGISLAKLAEKHEMSTVRMKRLIAKSTHFRMETTPNRSPKIYLLRKS